MSARVLSTDQAKSAIQQVRSIPSSGLAYRISRLVRPGVRSPL